jgi:hypothetical protein
MLYSRETNPRLQSVSRPRLLHVSALAQARLCGIASGGERESSAGFLPAHACLDDLPGWGKLFSRVISRDN